MYGTLRGNGTSAGLQLGAQLGPGLGEGEASYEALVYYTASELHGVACMPCNGKQIHNGMLENNTWVVGQA